MTPEAFLIRGLAWFGLASLGMLPYFLALRAYRRLIEGDPALRQASTAAVLDTLQSDPLREQARVRCRRQLFFGVAIYFLCAPLLPFILNA